MRIRLGKPDLNKLKRHLISFTTGGIAVCLLILPVLITTDPQKAIDLMGSVIFYMEFACLTLLFLKLKTEKTHTKGLKTGVLHSWEIIGL